MNHYETFTLLRDVDASLIPHGDKMILSKDAPAYITQSLGGSYTVVVGGNMYRVEGQDADAKFCSKCASKLGSSIFVVVGGGIPCALRIVSDMQYLMYSVRERFCFFASLRMRFFSLPVTLSTML